MPHRHSFPTRRSSDLIWTVADAAPPVPPVRVSFWATVGLILSLVALCATLTGLLAPEGLALAVIGLLASILGLVDRKSTRLNSSHMSISYAAFCLKKTNCEEDMAAGAAPAWVPPSLSTTWSMTLLAAPATAPHAAAWFPPTIFAGRCS